MRSGHRGAAQIFMRSPWARLVAHVRERISPHQLGRFGILSGCGNVLLYTSRIWLLESRSDSCCSQCPTVCCRSLHQRAVLVNLSVALPLPQQKQVGTPFDLGVLRSNMETPSGQSQSDRLQEYHPVRQVCLSKVLSSQISRFLLHLAWQLDCWVPLAS